MIDPRDACLALASVHEVLNAAKAQPARTEIMPGARLQIRPGHDAAYPSTSANRLLIYDPSAADLAGTMREADERFAAAGVTHWFAKLGAGVNARDVLRAMGAVGGQVWPQARYPVLGRAVAPIERAATSLDVRRVGEAEIRALAPRLVEVFDETGTANYLGTAGRPGFAHVLAFDGERPVAGGLLAMSGTTAYLCFGVTHPEFRNRGGQSALISERVNIAAKHGCDLCLSETVSFLTTSLNNLERAGFEVVFEWTVLEVGHAGAAGPTAGR